MAIRSHLASLILAFSALALSASVLAEEEPNLPKYEVGLGIGAVYQPHYPSSDQTDTTVIPFPYLIYRGDRLKVGRGGIVGELFDSKYINLDISLNGSLSVNSDDNDAREGMDDLDFTFELGPSLEILLYESPNEDSSIQIRFPFRAVFATDFSYLSHEGFLVEPDIKFNHRFGDSGWKLGSAIRVLYADNGYYDYFFGVDEAFVTPTRPAHQSDSGYGGVTFSTSLTKRWDRINAGVYAAYQFLDSVEYEDSPLYREDSAITLGFVMFVRLWESEERAAEQRGE